jgi:hypothetical protein
MGTGPYRIPPLSAFTEQERRLIRRLRTPLLVQKYLNTVPYNAEKGGETLRSFREVIRRNTAHCLEAALFAVTVLEQHDYPPLVIELGSIDGLDHVLFIYRKNGRWGAVAQSRDPGLYGRKPVFPTLRALVRSYFDAYIDFTGCLTGFAFVDLRRLGDYDWRFAKRNMWSVERFLLAQKQTRIPYSRRRAGRLRRKYREYRERYGKKPVYYRGRETWTPIPKEFY